MLVKGASSALTMGLKVMTDKFSSHCVNFDIVSYILVLGGVGIITFSDLYLLSPCCCVSMAVTCTSQDWGYSLLVLISAFSTCLFQYGVTFSTGVFYVIFLEHLDYTSAPLVAFGTGLNTSLMYALGESGTSWQGCLASFLANHQYWISTKTYLCWLGILEYAPICVMQFP